MPWFGGKRRAAPLVWERFGAVANVVEPFFGSGAVLLGRPDWQPGMTETVNDGQGRENAHKERIWFSPACIQAAGSPQMALGV